MDNSYEPPKKHRASLKRSQSAYAPRERQQDDNLPRSMSTDGPTNGAVSINQSPAVGENGDGESEENAPPLSPPVSPTEGLVRADADPAASPTADGHANGLFPSPRVVTRQPGAPVPAVPTSLLAPLDQPVPDDWATIEDDFVFVAGVYLTHLSKDMIAAPASRLDDGVIYLLLCRGTVTRLQLLGMFNDMETGKIEQRDNLEIVKVKAFRIEPLSEKGVVTVDGEAVDYGPLQAERLPGMARIMTPAHV